MGIYCIKPVGNMKNLSLGDKDNNNCIFFTSKYSPFNRLTPHVNKATTQRRATTDPATIEILRITPFLPETMQRELVMCDNKHFKL